MAFYHPVLSEEVLDLLAYFLDAIPLLYETLMRRIQGARKEERDIRASSQDA